MRHSHVERPVSSDARPSPLKSMYGTSDPLVGYAYTSALDPSPVRRTDRQGKEVNHLVGVRPSRCAPRPGLLCRR